MAPLGSYGSDDLYARTGVGENNGLGYYSDSYAQPLYAYAPAPAESRTGTGEYEPSAYRGSSYVASSQPSYSAPIPLAADHSRTGTGGGAHSSFSFVPKPNSWQTGPVNLSADRPQEVGVKSQRYGNFMFIPRVEIGQQPGDTAIANGYPKNAYDGTVTARHPQIYYYNAATRTADLIRNNRAPSQRPPQ